MTTRYDIVAEARDWLRTPWKHNAMVKGVGTDCVGFLAGVALELGLADARSHLRKPEFRAYGREPLPEVLDAACLEYLDRIPIADAWLGDVLRLRVPRGVYAQHFGIVSRVDGNVASHLIHATSASPRMVVENGIDDHWRARIARAYSFRGVT